MPKMTADEIQTAIARDQVLAVSLDTSVFDKYGDNLSFRVLLLVKQLPAMGIEFFLSEIVTEEVAKHIAADAAEAQRKLRSAINQFGKAWARRVDLTTLPKELALDNDPVAEGHRQVDEYVKNTGAQIIPAVPNLDTAKEVVDRYFKVQPPFETAETKKHEFPDAFALVALEAIGRIKRKLILCVSGDKGWQTFADVSKHLVYVPDVETALSYFTTAGRDTAEKALAMWRAGEAEQLSKRVVTALEQHFERRSFDPEAESGVSIEAEPLAAAVQFVDVGNANTPIVISADDEQVTFTLKVPVSVLFEAAFSFHVKDSIDRDDVTLDSTTRWIEKSVEMELVIIVAREIDPEPDALDVEVSSRAYLPVNFGYMEPFEDEVPYDDD